MLPRRVFFACLISVCSSPLFAPALAQPAPQPERYKAVEDETPIPKFSFNRYLTTDKFDREITFYLSKLRQADQEKKLPLVVCVQGSGCQSVFLEYKGMIVSTGTEAVALRDFKGQVRALVVEKPGVEFLKQPKRPGSGTEGSPEYNREFSLSRWVEAINAAVLAAREIEAVDASKVLLLGHSEGGQVACGVAAINPSVTHVAVMAGGGPTQLHDLIQLARKGALYDPAMPPQERVDVLLSDWKKVLAEPKATNKFILGHTHLRWSSFLASSPIESLLKTKAKVFIAQGTADTNSLPESADVLYAEMLARGRDVTYERIEGADHAFVKEGDTTGSGWSETNGKAIRWFLE